MVAPAEMAAPAEIAVQPGEITSQRTQTAQVGGQPIAMSEKSSNFAAHSSKESKASLGTPIKSAGDQGLCSPQKSEIFGGPKMRRH